MVMDIQKIAISEIKAAKYNPRKDLKPGDPEYEKLKKSLAEFDLVEPLIWNKRTGNLVGGHQRLKVLHARGDKEVQVSVVDLDDKKEKALNLALNKISGEWDFPLLKDLLQELDTGEFDIEVTGFSEKEIEDLVTQFHVPGEGLTPDDEIPEQVETVCKKGDLWQLGNHRLLCGDATVITDVEKLLGGEKAQLILTDPPYGINIVKVSNKITAADSGGSKPYGATSPGRQLANKRGRVVFTKICEANLYAPIEGDDKPFDPSLLLTLADNQIMFGANYYASRLPDGKAWIVWDKDVSGTFSEVELAWTSFEGRLRLYRHMWSGLRREGNRKDELTKRIHPTQKPVGLFVQILQDFKGEPILDCYGGSGSTLIACEKLGRRCYMMEISEAYCDTIRTRWERFTGKKAELLKDG